MCSIIWLDLGLLTSDVLVGFQSVFQFHFLGWLNVKVFLQQLSLSFSQLGRFFSLKIVIFS